MPKLVQSFAASLIRLASGLAVVNAAKKRSSQVSQEAILDRIKYDAYKINIVPVDPNRNRSMREVYGLDPALRE